MTTTGSIYIDPDGVSDVCRALEAILSRVDGAVYEATSSVRRTLYSQVPRGPHAHDMQRGISAGLSEMDALTSQQSQLDQQVRAVLSTLRAVADQARWMQEQLRSQATTLSGSISVSVVALWSTLTTPETGAKVGDDYDIVSPFLKDNIVTQGISLGITFWGEQHRDVRTLESDLLAQALEDLTIAVVAVGVAGAITAGLAAAGIAAPAVAIAAAAGAVVMVGQSLYAMDRKMMHLEGERLQREGAKESATDKRIGNALSSVGKNYITTYDNMNYHNIFQDIGKTVVDGFEQIAPINFHNPSVDSAIGFSTAQAGLKPGESLLGHDVGQAFGDIGHFIVSPVQQGVNEIASTGVEAASDINSLARNSPLPSPIKSGIMGATEGAASVFTGVSNFITNGHF